MRVGLYRTNVPRFKLQAVAAHVPFIHACKGSAVVPSAPCRQPAQRFGDPLLEQGLYSAPPLASSPQAVIASASGRSATNVECARSPMPTHKRGIAVLAQYASGWPGGAEGCGGSSPLGAVYPHPAVSEGISAKARARLNGLSQQSPNGSTNPRPSWQRVFLRLPVSLTVGAWPETFARIGP